MRRLTMVSPEITCPTSRIEGDHTFDSGIPSSRPRITHAFSCVFCVTTQSMSVAVSSALASVSRISRCA